MHAPPGATSTLPDESDVWVLHSTLAVDVRGPRSRAPVRAPTTGREGGSWDEVRK